MFVSPEDADLDTNLVELLRDEARFDAALKPLLDATFVRRRQTGTTMRIEMQPLVQQYVLREMSQEERLEWTKKTVCLVEHAIPQSTHLEDEQYESIRSIVLPHVSRCLYLARLSIKNGLQDLDDIHEPLVFMLLCSVDRSDRDEGLLDFVDSLLRYRSTVWQRCLAAKWKAYL
jgi:hypothetical protein